MPGNQDANPPSSCNDSPLFSTAELWCLLKENYLKDSYLFPQSRQKGELGTERQEIHEE